MKLIFSLFKHLPTPTDSQRDQWQRDMAEDFSSGRARLAKTSCLREVVRQITRDAEAKSLRDDTWDNNYPD